MSRLKILFGSQGRSAGTLRTITEHTLFCMIDSTRDVDPER